MKTTPCCEVFGGFHNFIVKGERGFFLFPRCDALKCTMLLSVDSLTCTNLWLKTRLVGFQNLVKCSEGIDAGSHPDRPAKVQCSEEVSTVSGAYRYEFHGIFVQWSWQDECWHTHPLHLLFAGWEGTLFVIPISHAMAGNADLKHMGSNQVLGSLEMSRCCWWEHAEKSDAIDCYSDAL